MKKTTSIRLSYITGLILILSSVIGTAAVYDLQQTYNGTQHKLRLNIPDSLNDNTIRAIFIHGNGANGDATSQANNSEYIAFAEHYGLAILATGYWGRFNSYDNSEIELLESMIAELATVSGHPELVNAPWLPTGHSNGGQMSYGINVKRPSKTIGFITGSGGYYNDLTPSAPCLLTPGMIICGELDRSYRVTANRNLFENNRQRGALWAWTEQEGSEHEEGEMYHLKLAFLEECLRLRYPSDQSPLDGPVRLKILDEYAGWLVNQNTWNNDTLVEIAPHKQVNDNFYDLAWVPSEKIAKIYQAFSTYKKIANHSNIQSSTSPISEGAEYKYLPTLSQDNWKKIEYFLNGIKVHETTHYKDDLQLTLKIKEGGFHTIYGIVTLNNNSQKTTAIRTFFQIGPKRETNFQKWLKNNKPETIYIMDPGIDPNQFLDENGNSSLLDGIKPNSISNFRVEQDASDNSQYSFDLICSHTQNQNNFLYKLTYKINISEQTYPTQIGQIIKSFSPHDIKNSSGLRLKMTIPTTFDGTNSTH